MPKQKTVTGYVYWPDGSYIGKHILVLSFASDKEAMIVNDGRNVTQRADGRWIYNPNNEEVKNSTRFDPVKEGKLFSDAFLEARQEVPLATLEVLDAFAPEARAKIGNKPIVKPMGPPSKAPKSGIIMEEPHEILRGNKQNLRKGNKRK
jgi:hypothetical protein